jgi:hypothetical protein
MKVPCSQGPANPEAAVHDSNAPRPSDWLGRRRQSPPKLYQVIIDCQDEAEQRAWYDRLSGAGAKLRLLVL